MAGLFDPRDPGLESAFQAARQIRFDPLSEALGIVQRTPKALAAAKESKEKKRIDEENRQLESTKTMSEIIKNQAFANKASQGQTFTEDDLITNSIIANPELFESLPPTIKARIIPKLSGKGFVYQGKPLRQEQQKTQENANSGLRALDVLEKEVKGPGGKLKTLKAKLPFAPGARLLRSSANEVKDVLQRLRTGAAINDQELDFYESQIPSVIDDEKTINFKISIFRNLFEGLSSRKPQISVGQSSQKNQNKQKKPVSLMSNEELLQGL